MNLKDYIQGKRRGKEANELERKALNDAFLQDALDGFDAVQGDHLPVIETLEKRINTPQTTKKVTPMWRWIAAAVAFLLIGTSLLEIFNYNNKDLPQVATVKPKTEIPTIKTKDSVIVADNIELKSSSNKPKTSRNIIVSNRNVVISTPVAVKDTLDGVEVIGYSSKEKSSSGYANSTISIKSDEIIFGNRIDTNGLIYGHNPASNSEFDKKALQGKVAGLSVHNEQENTFWLKNDSIKINPTLSKEIAKNDIITGKETEMTLQGKVAGLAFKKNKPQLYGSNRANTSENIRIRGISSITNTTPLKITKGRILDENGEPIIGASVMIKNSNIGNATNINGEFTLPLIDVNKDSLLVASYIGYERQEIPIKENVGDIKLLADNKTLDEVVVTAMGIQRKNSMVGSSSVSKVNTKKYVFYKKEFINYFKHYYDKNVCSGEKISIKVTFKLNENGHPTDVTKVETNCPEMETELKKRLENSPNWTKKNKIVTLSFTLKNK